MKRSEKERTAMRKALENIGYYEVDIEWACKTDLVTINEGRDGRDYAWALTDQCESAVALDTLQELSADEIEEYLA